MILIAFYLWKDIWRQWLTNPISLLSRVAVSSFLLLIALCVGVYFKAVEASVSSELEQMGLGRVMLTQFVYGERLTDISGSLDQRMAGMKADGAYVYFRRVPQLADVELVGEVPVLTYRDMDLFDLKHFLPQVDQIGAYLVTNQASIPEGATLGGWIRGLDLRFEVIHPSDIDLKQFGDRSFLLIPSQWVPWLEETGYVEMILFESRSDDLKQLEENIRKIQLFLSLDRYNEVTMNSGVSILERLEKLREQQDFWSWVIRAVVASLIVLIFASTAFLEYRQNIYLSALLQSLGVSKSFIYVRYFLEQMILLFLGLLIAFGMMSIGLEQVTWPSGLQGVDFTAFFALPVVVREWAPILLLTAVLSLMPVLIGLRKEVGRILQ